MKLSAIDIGSNSIHLVIAQATPGQHLDIIEREKEMVRLGAGTLRLHRLTKETIDRAQRADAFLSTEDLAGIALSHHERFDGDGYPNGLHGEKIPLEARVLAIADSLDAMMSRRPYRDSLPLSAALAEITRGAGGQFDPNIVGVLARDGGTFASGLRL